LQHASASPPLPPHTHTHTPGSQPLKCLTWQQDAEATELGVADAPVSISIKQRHHALSLLGRNAEAQHSGGTPHLPSIQPLVPVGIYRAENALQTRLLGLYVAAAGRRGGWGAGGMKGGEGMLGPGAAEAMQPTRLPTSPLEFLIVDFFAAVFIILLV
jgi:hypothetical protein